MSNDRPGDFERSAASTCFFCGASSAVVREIALRNPGAPDWIAVLKDEAPPLPGSGVCVTAGACDQHDDALSDALIDHFGHSSGWPRSLPGDTCSDPFHSGDPVEDPERYASESVEIGANWVGHGYECPTCGFKTMSVVEAVPLDDPAYVYARGILDATLGAVEPSLGTLA